MPDQPRPAELDDEGRCLADTSTYLAEHNEAFENAQMAVNLLAWGFDHGPDELPAEFAFPNDVAAHACFVLCLQDLRSSVTLCLTGHYASVWPIIRSAHESASVGRFLAKDPDCAQRWLHEGAWFPDGKARKWVAESGRFGLSADELEEYGSAYRFLSGKSHPTLSRATEVLDVTPDRLRFPTAIEFNAARFNDLMVIIAATGGFACFALRNAAADFRHFHPNWHRAIAEYHERITGILPDHLKRDWDEALREHERVQTVVGDSANMAETLDRDPRSWTNLRKRLDEDGIR